MIAQKEVQVLIAEIDRVLSKSSSPVSWLKSGGSNEQRKILERVRRYLISLQQSPNSQRNGMGELNNNGGTLDVVQVFTQEMETLRTSILEPLHSELDSLRQQREHLVKEIRQLEMQRLHYHSLSQQQTKQQQIISEFLPLLLSRLQDSLNQQLSQTLARLETQLFNTEVVEKIAPNNQSELYDPLHPKVRLDQLRQMQVQSDQLLMNLDASMRAVLDTLERNVLGYQDSLGEGVNKLHDLGQKGQLILTDFVSQLNEYLDLDLVNLKSSRLNNVPLVPNPDDEFPFAGRELSSDVNESDVNDDVLNTENSEVFNDQSLPIASDNQMTSQDNVNDYEWKIAIAPDHDLNHEVNNPSEIAIAPDHDLNHEVNNPSEIAIATDINHEVNNPSEIAIAPDINSEVNNGQENQEQNSEEQIEIITKITDLLPKIDIPEPQQNLNHELKNTGNLSNEETQDDQYIPASPEEDLLLPIDSEIDRNIDLLINTTSLQKLSEDLSKFQAGEVIQQEKISTTDQVNNINSSSNINIEETTNNLSKLPDLPVIPANNVISFEETHPESSLNIQANLAETPPESSLNIQANLVETPPELINTNNQIVDTLIPENNSKIDKLTVKNIPENSEIITENPVNNITPIPAITPITFITPINPIIPAISETIMETDFWVEMSDFSDIFIEDWQEFEIEGLIDDDQLIEPTIIEDFLRINNSSNSSTMLFTHNNIENESVNTQNNSPDISANSTFNHVNYYAENSGEFIRNIAELPTELPTELPKELPDHNW